MRAIWVELLHCRVCVRPQLGQQLPPHWAVVLPQAAGAPSLQQTCHNRQPKPQCADTEIE